MKTIDVITAQKVDINYALAGLMQRILAFVIDVIVIYVIYMLLIMLIMAVLPFNSDAFMTFIYIVMYPIVMFYHLYMEYFFNGQSLGKKALGIRVIKANGERPEFIDYLTRWMFRLVDVTFSAGVVAIVSILSSERQQRLGDIIGNTLVIQVQNPRNYTLKDVLKVTRFNDYELTYPDAKMFNEAQMLLLKETLERYSKYPNDAHVAAVKKLAQKFADQLGIEVPTKKISFLKVLLRDYIYLTR